MNGEAWSNGGEVIGDSSESVRGVPGWHPDPTGQHEGRFFDGVDWTEHVFTLGVQRTADIGVRMGRRVEVGRGHGRRPRTEAVAIVCNAAFVCMSTLDRPAAPDGLMPAQLPQWSPVPPVD